MPDPTAAVSRPSVAGGGRILFASSILLSSFLLFLVQPMLAKSMLPWFGGVAGVWTVAMLFFQGGLLLGYLYSYLSATYLPPRVQPVLHVALMAASALLLPLNPARPPTEGDPAMQILVVLVSAAGLPYFLLSTTGPLLQAWYFRSYGVAFPYRLFALSNAGSLAALLAYPVVLEPFVTTAGQLRAWSWAYCAFIVVCGLAAVAFWRLREGRPVLKAGESPAGNPTAPGPRDYLLWVALAACSSALLLGVTNHLCQNVAPMPLLWIAPLSTYLLTFILCFDRSGWYRPDYLRWIIPPVLALMIYGFFQPEAVSNLKTEVALYLLGLFGCCMFCHGELARRRPHGRYLTSFYLALAGGGAAGSLAVAVLAPRFTSWPVEFPAALVVCGLLAASLLYPAGWARKAAQVVLVAALVVLAPSGVYARIRNLMVVARSFYGAVSVSEKYYVPGDPSSLQRVMYHGWIRHGEQFVAPNLRRLGTSYYGPYSGAGIALRRIHEQPWRVGLVGLGVGTLAAYGKAGDTFQFYELDPLVAHVAVTQFWYLENSPAQVNVAIGDGRLLLERETGPPFDVLVLDAFLGDSIPVHLLTREAFELYFKRLKPGGIIAVHISNRYLDLRQPLAKAAAELKKQTLYIESKPDPRSHVMAADWVLMSGDPQALAPISQFGVPLAPPPDFSMWTDGYSNILQILGLPSGT